MIAATGVMAACCSFNPCTGGKHQDTGVKGAAKDPDALIEYMRLHGCCRMYFYAHSPNGKAYQTIVPHGGHPSDRVICEGVYTAVQLFRAVLVDG